MTRLLDIGVTGLNAHQRALNTTGHNITNAGVEGYSRQEAVFSTLDPQFRGDVFVGSGVSVDAIRRITNEFVVNQSFIDTARFNELNALNAGIEQLDTLLANEDTGLSGALNELFASFQAVSESPTSIALRAQVLSNSQRYLDRFQGISNQIVEINSQISEIVDTQIQQINSIATGIADLNRKITESSSGVGGAQPNDLLDKRDVLLTQLSEIVGFTTSRQDNSINVFIGGGQALVLGSRSNDLSVASSAGSGERIEIAIDGGGGRQQIITSSVKGGQVGGLIELSRQGVDDALNQLGLIQTQLAHSFNTLHAEGVDLNGLAGGDFFTSINDRSSQLARVESGVGNQSGDTITSVNIDDPSVLTASDYTLRLSSAGSLLAFQVIRESDGRLINEGSINNIFPQSIAVSDGFTINLESGNYASGDEFIIHPARVAVNDVNLLVADPASIALGLQIGTSSALGNLGTGVISQAVGGGNIGSNLDIAQVTALREQTPPLILRFTSNSTYDILDNSNPSAPVQLSPPLRNLSFLPGQLNAVLDYSPDNTVYTTTGAFAFNATPGFIGATDNGNLGETVTFTRTDPTTGSSSLEVINVLAGESAATAAARINAVNGAAAQANTEVTFTISDDGVAPPFQLRLNGVDLTDPGLGVVPSPVDVQFLAERITQLFAGSGVVASTNGAALSIRSLSGEDLVLENFSVGIAENLDIISVNGAPPPGSPVNVPAFNEVTIAGTVEVVLDENISLSSSGGFLASSTAQQLPAFVGYALSLSGQPQVGDEFIINTDSTGAGDNRNALALASLQTADVVSNGSSINDLYANLIGSVGNKAASARIDMEAAESILTQTQDRLSGISGVNLDEEAAKLIQFEQAYNASARIITIARSTFDSLLAAFS